MTNPSSYSPAARVPIAAAAILAAAALWQALSYWPGIMTWDALNQYGQAVEGAYDDWHPPVMAWIWRRMLALSAGPAPMFVLQLLLFWIGYALIVAAAFRRAGPRAGWATVVIALMPFPLALLGSVLKDCLMEGALLTATGLWLWSGAERGWPARAGILALLLFAATLRFNAFLAALPIAVASLPAAWRASWPRRLLATGGMAAALIAALPLANRAIGAEPSGVAWSLAIFDTAGITVRTGEDVLPPSGARDPVAAARACYRPDKWDYFSSWANPICAVTFDRIKAIADERGTTPYPLLLRAAATHPIAYAAHRLAHFNLNTRFLVHDEVQGPVPDRATPNEHGFVVPSNPGLRLLNRLTGWSIHSPLGWPIWWIAVAGGLLLLGRRLPNGAIVMPIAASALLYGLGYLPFSVSSELRYHLWTITGTGIALALALPSRLATRVPRRRMMIAFIPALLVACLCTVWRLT